MLDTILAYCDRYEGADRGEFFCGKSRNPDWRIHEHGTDESTFLPACFPAAAQLKFPT